MNIDEINTAISELVSGETTFATCQKLASLYTVREHLMPADDTEAKVISEYSDILPSYRIYCETKRNYQLNKLTISAVTDAMHNLCTEINEFLHIIYANTETQDERSILRDKLNQFINSIEG